jgi:hypothetical protein
MRSLGINGQNQTSVAAYGLCAQVIWQNGWNYPKSIFGFCIQISKLIQFFWQVQVGKEPLRVRGRLFVLNFLDFSIRYDNKKIENLNKEDLFKQKLKN